MKNKNNLIIFMLVLLLTALGSSVLAQDEEIGETAVETPPLDYIETIKVEPLATGETLVSAIIYADKATFISSGNPNTNYGSWGDMYFGYQPGGYGAMRPFLRFPVNQLPAGATITSATFNIYLISVEDTQSRKYNAYTNNSNWEDLSLVWNNQPGRSSQVAWEANLSNTIGWHATNATSLVQNWYSNPGSNFGLQIVGEEQSTNNVRRYSSNGQINAPYLNVQYTTNSTPPAAWVTTISPYVNTGGINWTSPHFNIAWSATDYSGTGIKWYDMYYTGNNGSNWIIGQAQVTHTSTPFGPLTNGTTYGFYVRARDNTNLEGPAPSGSGSIQKSVTIDGSPPVVTIQPLPPHTDATGETLNWAGGTDYGSGIQNYDVQWRAAGGTWANLLSGTTLTSYHVIGGTNGTTYEFRARGRDKVGNVPDWSTVPTASTTVWLEPTAYITGFQDTTTSEPIVIYSKDPVGPENNDEFRVLWAGDAAPNTSIVSFDLRYQKPGNPTWFTWQTDIQTTSANFVMTANTTDFPDGIYIFQVKAKDSAGQVGDYHTETQGKIVVDREPPWMTDNVIFFPVVFKED
ncbi:MAG: DNRLRE domain-containing protein [Anaerolineae bacterium]|nr:DNRLRE domain-containing protein [Anaerolineae bacterium]